MRKSLDTIDIAKFVASVLVFAMHCNALGDYGLAGIVLEVLARWGVPFFFLCSAYFLFSKSVHGLETQSVNKYAARIGKLYLIWLVYNLPSVYWNRLYKKNLLSAKTWLTVIKNSLLSSTFTGSWYLVSCIFCAYFIYVLSKRFKTKTIVCISLPLYLLSAVSSAYHGVLPVGLSKVLRFLNFPLNFFGGCLYFSLGKYIAENRSTVVRIFTKWRALVCFILSYIVFGFEIYATKRLGILRMTDVAFSTAVVAFMLFLFCLQTEVQIKNGALLRKLSTIIYCSQGNVLLVNALGRKLFGSSIAGFLLSSVVISLICVVVLRVQKSNRWKWADYLT